jgi:hypothetical protein
MNPQHQCNGSTTTPQLFTAGLIPARFARQGQWHMEISKVDNEIQGALGRIVGC